MNIKEIDWNNLRCGGLKTSRVRPHIEPFKSMYSGEVVLIRNGLDVMMVECNKPAITIVKTDAGTKAMCPDCAMRYLEIILQPKGDDGVNAIRKEHLSR